MGLPGIMSMGERLNLGSTVITIGYSNLNQHVERARHIISGEIRPQFWLFLHGLTNQGRTDRLVGEDESPIAAPLFSELESSSEPSL